LEEKKNILLVEDDRQLGTVVKDFLEGSGFAVEYQHNAALARAKMLLDSDLFDLIILDWDLGELTGVELCQEFRSVGGLTPILFMTGRTSIDDKEMGLEAGGDDYITKPFSMRELAARVKSILRRSGEYSPKPKVSASVVLNGSLIADRYLLEQAIGSGGSANVWKALDQRMNRHVVVKVMQGHLIGSDETMKRFEHECQLMAKIKHPNVVTVYDAGSIDGRLPFLVMELVEGESLRDFLDRSQRLPLPTAAAIMVQVCAGLRDAHAAGIVHRDLKPENILIQENKSRVDSVKIVDFGIARLVGSADRLTREGTVIGTIDYISPEQLEDRAVDSRADIYALGIMLFELLTGAVPFQGDTMQTVAVKHLIESPGRLEDLVEDLPEREFVQAILDKCLEKKPELRYQSTDELVSDLESVLRKTS
jgi:serine/threonine protein kinase